MEIKKTVKEWIEIFHSLFLLPLPLCKKAEPIRRVMACPCVVIPGRRRRIGISGGIEGIQL